MTACPLNRDYSMNSYVAHPPALKFCLTARKLEALQDPTGL